MIDSSGKKINGRPPGLNQNWLYRAADIAAHFEVDQQVNDLIEKALLTPHGTYERPAGVRVGKHIVVHVNVWIQTYKIVIENLEQSSQEGQGR